MEPALLRTKLYIPPLRAEYIPRPRLETYLQDGMRARLTLLSAPAGFGKSTLLAAWIHRNHIRAAWLSLDEGENDLARFLSYLIGTLQTVLPGVGNGAADLLRATQLRSHEAVLNLLINELAETDENIALVLDDYHLIREQPVHAALRYLLEHLPECVHIYLATRVDPPLPLSLLRGRREMIELRANQLRFTQSEAAEFIHQATGKRLSELDASTLTRLTEGWITGIQMAALSLRGHAGITDFLRDFSGDNRYVLDYLIEEVLETQAKRTQDFLHATSILDRMNGPLCDALLKNGGEPSERADFAPGDGRRMLADLERQNLFIIPLDENRNWYRYHHLFADLLRQRLRTRHPASVPALHRRAASWFRGEGLLPEAIQHSLACDDYAHAADLIAAVAEEAIMRSDFVMLKGWIDCLPAEVLNNYPRLHIFLLLTSIFSGLTPEEAEHRLEMVRDLDAGRQVEGEILALQAMLAVYRQDIRRSSELATQALKTLPEDRFLFRSMIAGFLGFAYMMNGDIHSARQTLEESARVSGRAGNLTMQALALCHLAEIAIIEARMPDAEMYYNQAMQICLDAEGNPRPIAGMAYTGLGILERERGELDEAMIHLEKGASLIQKWTPTGAVQAYVNMAWIHELRGERASADAALETAASLARMFEPLEEDDKYVLCHRAKLQTIRGNPEQALRLVLVSPEISLSDLDSLFPIVALDEKQSFADLIVYVTAGEAFKALERYEIAEELFSRALDVTHSRGWTRVEISILTSQAEIHARCGRLDRALQTLKPALKIAARGRHRIDFLERGARITGLLQEALRAGIEPVFVASLLARIDTPEIAAPSGTRNHQPNLLLPEPLSEREFEVLSLLAEGYSNAEIAARLVLAVNTVKKHVSNIFGKMGVSNRKQAVEQARMLGLL